MRLVKTAIVMGILTAAVAGCATNHDSPKRFVGQPISTVMATMPKYGGYQEADSRGHPYYRWNFTEALLSYSRFRCSAPFPPLVQDMRRVSGVPSAVKRLRRAIRIWTSASCLSKSLAMMRSPKSLRHRIFASTLLRW